METVQNEPLTYLNGQAQLFTLGAEQMGEFWPIIVKFLLMVESRDWTTDEVYEAIIHKEAQVWGMADSGDLMGFCITRVQNERERYGLLWICAGRGIDKALPALFTCIEPWFKSLGCKYVKIYGRRGWLRMMAKHGYVEHAVEVRKQLSKIP